MQHIVLFEPDPSGHRMVFVRYIVEAMVRHGGMRATLIVDRRGSASNAVTALRAIAGRHLTVHVMADHVTPRGPLALSAKLSRQFGFGRALRSAVRAIGEQGRVDHVHIPFVDDYGLFPFAVRRRPFGDIPWSGIAIRPRFHLAPIGANVPRRREDRIEAWAYRQLLRSPTLTTLFSIDPYLEMFLGDPRIRTVHDPADITDRSPNAGWLPVAVDATVLLAYGYVDHRKAIDRLLRAATHPDVPSSLVIALVGVQDPAMTSIMAGPDAETLRRAGRLVEIPRHVDDVEEASAFARADIVWCYYPGSYCSSGAMVRAGQMGRPLLATAEGLVGHLTAINDLGLSAPEHDDVALTEQLVRLATDADLRSRLGAAGKAHFGSATGEAFGDDIVARLTGDA